MYPAATHTERVATQDDVIPLRFPIKTMDGKMTDFIRVKEGQVSVSLHVRVSFDLTNASPVLGLPYRVLGREPRSLSLG